MAVADETQLLHDSNREIYILQTLLRSDTSNSAVQAFTDCYVPLVQRIMDTRLDESAKKFKAQAAYLTGLAGIASFLASVQIGFFPIISNPDCGANPQPDGCGNHLILIRAVINFFSYLALSFDALGALFALLTARSLLQVSSDAQDLMDDKYNLDGFILGQLDHLDSPMFPTLQKQSDSLYERVGRQDHIVQKHTGGAHGVIAFILLGMICFLVGLLLQVIQSQPLGFWIPFLILVTTMGFILAGSEGRHHTGLRSRAMAVWKNWIHGPGPINDVEKSDIELEEEGAEIVGTPGKHHNVGKLLPGSGVRAGYANPKIQGGRYGTPLYAASESADVDIVKLLLKGGADPNIEGGEYGTPLQVAVHAGDEEIVKILIQHGADVNTQSGRYGTALYAASHGANFNIVKLLLDNGADPNVGGNGADLLEYEKPLKLMDNSKGINPTDNVLNSKGKQRDLELQNLEVALQKFQEAVDLTPEGHPDKPDRLSSLALSFTDRYEKLGDLNDLEAALQRFQEAVDLTPQGHPDRAGHLEKLAITFRYRYQTLGDLNDLEVALQRFQEAVDLTPKGHPDRAGHVQNLAISFWEQYQKLGDLNDLEAALQIFQDAVDLTPDSHPDRVDHLKNLAIAFRDRYQRLGNLSDLESALQRFQEAVNLTPKGHPDGAGHLQNLAISFRERYQSLGDLNDLEAALQTFQDAVDLTPASHPDKVDHLRNLAIAFRDRYQRLGNLSDLEAALQRFQERVDLTPEGNSDRAGYLQPLAISFRYRYERLGDLHDLEAALHGFQEAVNLTHEGHPYMPGWLHNLGISFRDKYQRLGDLKDFEAALQRFQQAVDLTPQNFPDRASRLQDLAISFRDRYQRLGDLDDLEAALRSNQEALSLIQKGHPDMADCLQNLAMCFTDKYRRLHRPEDLENVHTHYAASFDIPTSDPEHSWNAALNWASVAVEFKSPKCITAYSNAFRLLPEIIWIGNMVYTLTVPHEVVHRLDIAQVISAAAMTCINFSELTSAVVMMEQGLSIIYQEMFQLRTDLDALPPHQAHELQLLSSELYSWVSRDPRNLAMRRQDLLEKIRKQPGLEHFLLPKPYMLLRHASQRGPVVILNSHQDRCDGIILLDPASDPVHVPLPTVTLDILNAQKEALRELLGHYNVRTQGESTPSRLSGHHELFGSKTPEDCFADLLTWLYSHVVAPIYQVLESHGIHNGRLWWLPTGSFTGLPLHASSPTDQFIQSYTATLGSLLDAYSKKSSSAPKVGVIGVSHTSGGVNYLPGVEQEVKTVLSAIKGVPVESLEGQQATVDAAKLQLQACSWIHMACPVIQDLEPTKSHLLLCDGILELETILQMPLSNAEFVFLSVCHTAIGDLKQVNESFHPGEGFIAAGFRGAIGTVWSIHDQDGPLVAEIIYSHLFREGRQPQASDTAEALQLAVKELKARKVPYERWMPFIHMGV